MLDLALEAVKVELRQEYGGIVIKDSLEGRVTCQRMQLILDTRSLSDSKQPSVTVMRTGTLHHEIYSWQFHLPAISTMPGREGHIPITSYIELSAHQAACCHLLFLELLDMIKAEYKQRNRTPPENIQLGFAGTYTVYGTYKD